MNTKRKRAPTMEETDRLMRLQASGNRWSRGQSRAVQGIFRQPLASQRAPSSAPEVSEQPEP